MKGLTIRRRATKKLIFLLYLSVICPSLAFAQLNVSKTDVTTAGADDGTATATVSGGTAPYVYAWSNGESSAHISGLAAGVYNITVTDAYFCTATESVSISEPGELTVSISGGSAQVEYCSDDGAPSITLTASASGGTPPYIFSWPGGSITVNSSGTYSCSVTDQDNAQASASISIVFIEIECSEDPNDIIGPDGYGPQQWVAVEDEMNYMIRFENDPEFASAPAQKVVVYLPIDPNANAYNLRLNDFGFGDFNYLLPANTTFYTNRLDVTDSLNVYVDVLAGLDITNNRAFWIFESIDPSTGLAPMDAFTGFLPVNDTITRRGEGYVTFSYTPIGTANTGDSLFAEAEIFFDDNNSIFTNEWFNTLDALPPTSYIDPIPLYTDTNHVPVTFTANDDNGGSGVKECKLYYRKNQGSWNLYGTFEPDTTVYFTANPGVYQLFSVASDNAGNAENMKSSPEAELTILDTLKLAVSGNISYDNAAATPFDGITAYLIRDNGRIDSVITDANGDFVFGDVVDGTYILTASTDKDWGGVNATDALMINRNAIGLLNLSPLKTLAANVNGQNNVTSTDALLTLRRSVGLDTAFDAGDWAFESDTIIVHNDTITAQNFLGICMADVNASYNPNTLKTETVSLHYADEIQLKENETTNIPIKIKSAENIGAVTLTLNYNSEQIAITGIKSPLDGFIFAIKTDQVRIAWNNINPYPTKKDDILFWFEIKATEKLLTNPVSKFTLDNYSEFADEYADVLQGINLEMPVITAHKEGINVPDKFMLSDNFPNPFNNITIIEYGLPEKAHVNLELYNMIGEKIETLVQENHEKGIYRYVFDAGDLASGMYQYRITFLTRGDLIVKTKRMIIDTKQH